MITPTVWTSGPVVLTETTGLADADVWQLINPDTDVVVATGGVDSATAGQIVFTPDTPVVEDVYTVVVLDTTGAEIIRYPSALAVLAATPPSIPDGVQLEWVDDWGAVRFTVGGMAADETVRLIGPGNVLIPIRGYETGEWHVGSDEGYGFAFEMPLGVTVGFGIAKVGALTWQGGLFATIVTPEGRAWLRDLHNPLLSLEVVVSSTGTEAKPARQTIHEISGRPKPIVRWDVRGGRRGTIILRVENSANDFWVKTNRDKLDDLLETGRPLLLSLCHTKGFAPCYMAVGDYRPTRLGTLARWSVELDYVEVDNPTSVDVIIPTEVTWEQAQQIPPNATWADWAAVRWIDIATRTSV